MESGCILNRLATHSRLLGPTFVLTSRDTWGCHSFAGITSKSPGCRSAAGLGVSFVRPAKWMTACPFALQLSFSCCRVLFVLGFGAVSSFCSHCPFGYISFRKKKKSLHLILAIFGMLNALFSLLSWTGWNLSSRSIYPFIDHLKLSGFRYEKTYVMALKHISIYTLILPISQGVSFSSLSSHHLSLQIRSLILDPRA